MPTATPRDAVASGQPARDAARRSAWQGMDHANVMSMELVAAILTWGGLGWLADRWLGTTPWLIVLGALIGNAAGLYLVWLRSQRMDAEEARHQATVDAERDARLDQRRAAQAAVADVFDTSSTPALGQGVRQ